MISSPTSQQREPNSSRYSRYSSVSRRQSPRMPPTVSPNSSSIVQVPPESGNGALAKIESLLETILEAINTGVELVIPYQNVRSLPADTRLRSAQKNRRQSDGVRFPGRTIQEARKFGALFRILELSHEALLSGKLITKRNIYYQDPALFKSQSVVDDMVDNLAFTLGVGRGDLNIVAAAKGLISGPIELILRDGSVNNCGFPSDTGLLLPAVNLIQTIDFGSTGWLLVIEKEATFRTLAASQYSRLSKAGHGILLTAKGFPDLATRRFVSMLQNVRPELDIFALVDFDPHGHSFDGSQSPRPIKRARVSTMNSPSESVSLLTPQDRKKAVEVMREISLMEAVDNHALEQIHELQRMLVLNIKAEIQAADNYGDIADWLDTKLKV
ncbi:endodeoxyribonuclease [Madurella fahalii]|uniref:DNA topoisomerase (ATP-hydrolyzing) n=1 Tax=Madurella fahalii TaxID=1157608 RepID=A0ABQ0GA18_9PEZI